MMIRGVIRILRFAYVDIRERMRSDPTALILHWVRLDGKHTSVRYYR